MENAPDNSAFGSRIRALRKELMLTQNEFGEKIGLTQNTITKYENGLRNPSNQIVLSICREFNVNEIWLRTGEGGDENMFKKVSKDDEYSISLGKLTMEENEFVRNTVKYLANAAPEKLKTIEEFMMSCLGIDKKERE